MSDIAKPAARLLLGLAVLIGVPVALIITVGWPLPRAVPSWAEITDGFSRQGVQVDTVTRVLAVIVWCAWAQLAVAIVVETAAAVRGRTSHHVALLPGTQLLARQFVASATLVLTMLGPDRAATAAPGDTPQLAAIEVAPAVAVAAAVPVVSETPFTTTVPPGEYVVLPGDSYWGLAETHLGDGSRWAEIRDANIGRTVDGGRVITAHDDDLHPGWHIVLPTDDDATGESTAPPSLRSSEVQVAPGDHFWGLAASHLQEAWGRSASEPEVREYWTVLVEANRDRLVPPGDPSEIYAGQVFVTPDPGPDPAGPAPENPATGEASGDEADVTVPDEPIGDDAADGEAPAPVPETPLEPPTAEQSEPTDLDDADAEQPPSTEPNSDAEEVTASASTVPATMAERLEPRRGSLAPETTRADDGDDEGSAAPVAPVLGAASTALAVAVLRELRRRRGRRAALLPVDVVPSAPPRSSRPAAQEVLAADEDQIDALDAALASLCATLNPRGGERCIQPKVVQVTGSRVEVMLDRPDPAPPPPWRPEASGRVWVLDDASELSVPDAASPLPALVTIGVDDAQLLIDLEAFGVVTLTGDHDHCWAMARSMVTELAAKHEGAMGIDLVGALDGRLDDLDGVRHVASWDEADTGVIVGSARMLDAGRWPHTFAARASGRVFDGWAPAMWVTAPSDSGRYRDVVEQVGTRPGAGSAIVIVAGGVDASASGGVRIVIDQDGGFRVPELSLSGRAQLLDAEVVDQVLDLLEDAAHTTYAETIDFPTLDLDDEALVDDEDGAIVGLDDDWSPPLDDAEQDQDPFSALDATDAPPAENPSAIDTPASPRSLSPDQDRYEDPPWSVLVRVCGEIAVEGGLSALTGPEAAAATYVALHREADVDQIRDAVWGGQDVSRKRVRNVLANVRRALGEEMYYVSEGRLAAGEHCLTDHELIGRRLAYARHQTDPVARVATLRGALEWATGKVCTYPSRSRRAWNWIDLDNWIPNVESTVGAVAHDLAALYLELGDAEGATWAASRGIDATGHREQLTVLLVRGYGLAGDDPAAAAALRAYERYMEDHGGADHSEELLGLLDRYLPTGRARAC